MNKKLYVTLATLVGLVSLSLADKPVYASGNINGHGYEIIPAPLPWHLAKKKANELGGYLVSITSPEENEFIISLVNKSTKNETCEIWIGFNDEKREGDWKWLSEDKATFNYWHNSQPDNWNNGENAVVFVKNDQGYRWNDRATDTRLPYIVEFNKSIEVDENGESGSGKTSLRSTR